MVLLLCLSWLSSEFEGMPVRQGFSAVHLLLSQAPAPPTRRGLPPRPEPEAGSPTASGSATSPSDTPHLGLGVAHVTGSAGIRASISLPPRVLRSSCAPAATGGRPPSGPSVSPADANLPSSSLGCNVRLDTPPEEGCQKGFGKIALVSTYGLNLECVLLMERIEQVARAFHL